MKITNHYGLPETIVRAVEDDEYDRGGADISVTQLISPPRIVILQDLNADKIVVDVVDRLAALLGSAAHKIIEKGAKDLPGHIIEERLFVKTQGWVVSGAIDLQIEKEPGKWAINDYKVTSVYSVMMDKIEWEQQLNLYSALMWLAKGRVVAELEIIAILRDWSRKTSQMRNDYPLSPIIRVPIKLWDPNKQLNFLEERVRVHKGAREGVDNDLSPPYCTKSERWFRGETWALMKEGRKSALKLYGAENEAVAARESLGDGHTIEYRPGTFTRCEGNYCNVRQWCKQWLERDDDGGAGDGTG